MPGQLKITPLAAGGTTLDVKVGDQDEQVAITIGVVQQNVYAFNHSDEVARPYEYSVTFTNGLKAEMTPTDHAAVMRFTFPGNDANLIFDNVNDDSSLTIDQASGVVTGWSDVGLANGATRMYVYATFDRPITASGMLPDGNRVSTGYAKFAAGPTRTVTMRIATSLMSTSPILPEPFAMLQL